MIITFLIGNGFDVGLGLHSKFKDFFPIYVDKAKNKKEEIRQLAEKIGNDYDTWSDFETQMGQYTNSFNAKTKQLCRDQFHDFEIEFISYLRKEEEQLSFKAQDEIYSMMIAALTEFYSLQNLNVGSHSSIASVFKTHQSYGHVYQFINFNYTSVLEKCLNIIPDGIVCERKPNGPILRDTIGAVVHVHGTLDNAAIMGVDNVSQIANKELSQDERFVRYLVKPVLNSVHRTYQDELAASMIEESQIICVYGMALGITDKRWWIRVIEWLNSTANRQLVIFDYDPQFNHSSQFDWIDKEDYYMDKLASYIDDKKIDIEKLRQRIHIAVHKNIFEKNLRILSNKEIAQKLYGITDEETLATFA